MRRVAAVLSSLGPLYQDDDALGPVGFAYSHAAYIAEAIDELQPVHGGAGRFVLLFDGRLDNREALAGQLNISTGELAGLSDSALAMRGFERWGEALPKHLLGEFAFIVWDGAEQKLFAARDPFGFRTLSYHATRDRVVIASSPNGVFAAGGIERVVDMQKLADAMGDFHDDGGRSFFKGISRVPPAHTLRVDRENLRLERYWSLEYRGRDIRLPSDEAYVEAGRELLDTCVKARMRTNGTIGAELSGGLDSSAVAVTALQFLDRQNRLPVFTNVAESGWSGRVGRGWYGDEAPLVRRIVEMHPRLEPTFLSGEGLGWDHAMDDTFEATGVVSWAPMGNMTVDQTFRAARDRGVKVLMCGGAGNGTLSWGGNGAYADWLTSGRFIRLYRELAAVSPNPYVFARQLMSKAVIPAGPDWLWNLYMRWKGVKRSNPAWQHCSLINPDFAADMRIEERAAEFGFNFYGRPLRDTRDQRARALVGDLSNEIGEHNQGLRARFGIEYRDPMYDVRLIEWCLRIPEEQFIRNGLGRWLMRRIMAGRLPDEVVFNRKRGAIVPDWHARMTRDLPRMREQLEVLASDPDVAAIIDVPRIRKMLDDWPAEAPVTYGDPQTWLLPRCLPHALAVGRFVRRAKGANL